MHTTHDLLRLIQIKQNKGFFVPNWIALIRSQHRIFAMGLISGSKEDDFLYSVWLIDFGAGSADIWLVNVWRTRGARVLGLGDNG